MRTSQRRLVGPLFAVVTFVLMGLGACAQSEDEQEPPKTSNNGGFETDSGEASTPDAGIADGQGVVSDARPDVVSECFDGGESLKGPGPISRICLTDTPDECDGAHDFGLGFPPNGTTGNGFDDDCDGLVDEGCRCDGAGTTKECFLVPAVQTLGKEPVGWCKTNSRGTMACAGGEFPVWSGICRGAQPPFADDFCSVGDFDCDGRDLNSETEDCACHNSPVACPADPIVTVPFPNPSALPMRIDGLSWLVDPANAPKLRNWKWSIRGGDCDNILPHPTFGIYSSSDGSGEPLGAQDDALGSGHEHGMVASEPDVGTSIYPAFSLSGDYIVTGEFEFEGHRYACNQKVQVRAPGIRAEACWTTAGSSDIDLHLAAVNRMPYALCENKSWGWSGTGCQGQDCNYKNCKNESSDGLHWYDDSPASACVGWGSQSHGAACSNPRLDRDLIGASCKQNPNSSDFCGPENINIDRPQDGDIFAVELATFGGSGGLAHINIYCNGERVLAAGYDPTVVPVSPYPHLQESGGDDRGDIWKMGLIYAHVENGVLNCNVKPTRSRVAVPSTEGPVSIPGGPGAYCVDNGSRPGEEQSGRLLTPMGIMPNAPQDLCFH